MDFVQRLPQWNGWAWHERWLVRRGSELCSAWLISDEPIEWLREIEGNTAQWIGFAHPRVSRVLERSWLTERVLAFIVDDDRGPSFAEAARLLADAPIDRERWAIAQIITIADALATMARRVPGFVHRRLEPHQIFVDPTGHARLRAPIETITFGRPPTRPGSIEVTRRIDYMSPEQCRGLPISPAGDVFSLAGNLAVALTGRPPFGGQIDDWNGLMTILQQPPAPIPTHAPGLASVLARAFAKEPRDRYPDVAAFGAALYECVPDAGDYDAVISDRIAAWWPSAPQSTGAAELIGGPRCRLRWEQLTPTGTDNIRHCASCNRHVLHATSPSEIVPLAGGSCFSYESK